MECTVAKSQATASKLIADSLLKSSELLMRMKFTLNMEIYVHKVHNE